jgi:hypothetical protein
MMDESDMYNTKQQGWHKELGASQHIMQNHMLKKDRQAAVWYQQVAGLEAGQVTKNMTQAQRSRTFLNP